MTIIYFKNLTVGLGQMVQCGATPMIEQIYVNHNGLLCLLFTVVRVCCVVDIPADVVYIF